MSSGVLLQRTISGSWRWCSAGLHAWSMLTLDPPPMLQHPQWHIPQERRAQAKVSMVHRIVYNLVVNHLAPTISIRAHNIRFLVPFARTLVYQRSFFADTIRIWNSLPQSRVLPFHRQLQKGRADHQTSSDSYRMI